MNAPELRDIQLPDASLWWPPGPGWWLLLGLVLLLVLLLPWLRRRLAQQPIRRLALKEFEDIRELYRNGQSDKSTLDQLACLLRRILISYRGRPAFAASTGEAWQQQLEQLAPQHAFSSEQIQLLAQRRYQADCAGDVESLLLACEAWIKSLPRGQGHAAA